MACLFLGCEIQADFWICSNASKGGRSKNASYEGDVASVCGIRLLPLVTDGDCVRQLPI